MSEEQHSADAAPATAAELQAELEKATDVFQFEPDALEMMTLGLQVMTCIAILHQLEQIHALLRQGAEPCER